MLDAHRPAQDGQPLRWKAFDEGAKPFYQILQTKTVQQMKVMGQDVNQEQLQTFYVKWTPAAKKLRLNGRDHWVVAYQIIGVKMDITIGGNKITYDSTDPNQAQAPLNDFFNALVGSELTFYITEDFRVARIDKVDEFVKKVGKANPQMEALLKSILSENALKQSAETIFTAYPPKGDFQPQKQWQKTQEQDFGPVGVYHHKNTYTCEANPLKIRIRTTLEYKQPTRADGALPFKIVKAKLTGNTAKEGEAVFDRVKGRFATSTLQVRVEGELTIEIGGMETTVQLTQTQESRMHTQDADPVAELKKKRQ